MAALTTLLAGVSLAVGIGGAVSSAKNNARALALSKQQFKDQQTQAIEAGKVKAFKDDTGAKFKVGSSDYGLRRDDTKPRVPTPARTGTGSAAGGLSVSAAAAGGL